jgi:hypothetical protein
MTDTVTEPTPDISGETQRFGPGVILSLLVHALVLFLLLHRIGEPEIAPPILPVEIVPFGAETTPPPAAGTAGPQRQASVQPPRPRPPSRREQANPNPPSKTAPSKNQEPTNDSPAPPRDALQEKLEDLSKLTQPETDSRLLDSLETGGRSATGNGKGRGAQTYSVKDYIRAQVERRWNLDFGALGNRRLTIAIHVVLKPDGSVAKAEIVDLGQHDDDKLYRYIAISARNAVILSSPFALPPGSYDLVKDMVLELNPRDTVR